MTDEARGFGDTPQHVVSQIVEKSWGELEALEHNDYILFPAEIHRRRKDGTFEETKVLIRVPKEPDLRKARVASRRMAIEDGLDLDRDSDLVDNLETICTLADCIRNVSTPHESWEPDPRILERRYDRQSLLQIFTKVGAYVRLVDPAGQAIDPNMMVHLIAAIAKERSVLPLAVYAPPLQDSFIVSMACHLHSLLESKSSSEPSEPLTPES